MPVHQWLIAAFCDEETNSIQIELDLHHDIDIYKQKFATAECKPFPYEINPIFEWIPISDIEPGINRGYDELVEMSIASRIRARIDHMLKLRALALLLDRNLLAKNNMGYLFAPIVRYKFFNPTREPIHFICCFGDTPKDGMRCNDVSCTECRTFGWCAMCESDDMLIKCKHTCYWHLIRLLLGAYPVPRPNPHTNKTVANLLPSHTYIY